MLHCSDFRSLKSDYEKNQSEFRMSFNLDKLDGGEMIVGAAALGKVASKYTNKEDIEGFYIISTYCGGWL